MEIIELEDEKKSIDEKQIESKNLCDAMKWINICTVGVLEEKERGREILQRRNA